MQTPYILMAIVAIIIILLLLVFIKKPKPQTVLSPLTILAFFSIIAGLTLTNNNKLLSYCLFGLGVVLAVIDMGLKARKQK
jgi:bacteriorhodopsin